MGKGLHEVFKAVFNDILQALPMAIRPTVSCIPCATSSREKIGDIIKFTHFEEGNLL